LDYFFSLINYKNYRKLNRYNIENYIYDPINLIFAILNKKGQTQTDIFQEIASIISNTKNPEKCDFYDNLDFVIPDFDRAVIYSFMITSAFNACHARGAGFSGITKTNKLKLTTLINKLKKEEYHKKLDKLNHVESCDFEDLIKKWDSNDTYFYLDPPYKYTDGAGTHDQDYGSKSMFGDDSHERLAKLLQNTKSRWALSYYWFKELEEWFPRDKYRWISREFHRPSASFSNDTKGTELLIMNYDENFKKF
jgi:site-specific DNA-adenine methylase